MANPPDNSRISIIIPCYNEEKGLKSVLGSEALSNGKYEVIVVDNGSNDNSAGIARGYNAKVLSERVAGYGRALQRGLSQANTDIIVLMDADGSYPTEVLKEICSLVEKGNFDFVSGCRFPLTDFKAMPLINILSNYFISSLIRALFGINLKDSQSGMMVFKKNILEKIRVDNMGMGFSQEIKIKAYLCREIKCAEFHIPYYPRIGKVKFRKLRDSTKNLYDLLMLRIREKEPG